METADWGDGIIIWIGLISGIITIILAAIPLTRWIIKKFKQQSRMIRPHKTYRFLRRLFGKKKPPIGIYTFSSTKKK